MDRSGADAFVYARACGMYSRSFVGVRARRLFEAKSLQELWAMLFEEDCPLVPEGMLALLLERKASERVTGDFITLLSQYDRPDPVSRAFLALYDYNNLKAVTSSLSLGAKEKPFTVDLGPFALFDMRRWSDIAALTRDTPVAWFNRVPAPEELVQWETRLDQAWYRDLWLSLGSLSAPDRVATEDLVREEIILSNIVWALRLRVYYRMSADEIVPLLAGSGKGAESMKELCAPALAILNHSIDSWGDWADWKYRWLLNPHEEGAPWELDPRWAQLAADKYLFRMALNRFHQHPFTPCVLVSFFKIKQLEEQMIRVAAEGLRLGASDGDYREFTGGADNA